MSFVDYQRDYSDGPDGEDVMLAHFASLDKGPVFHCPHCIDVECEMESTQRIDYRGEAIYRPSNIELVESYVWKCPRCDRRWSVDEIPF